MEKPIAHERGCTGTGTRNHWYRVKLCSRRKLAYRVYPTLHERTFLTTSKKFIELNVSFFAECSDSCR